MNKAAGVGYFTSRHWRKFSNRRAGILPVQARCLPYGLVGELTPKSTRLGRTSKPP